MLFESIESDILYLDLRISAQLLISCSYLGTLPGAYPTPEQTTNHGDVTFLGEKLSAVLPSSNHFAWDLPKELHDQSDVVCPPPHTSQREQAGSALQHAHTRPHNWLCGTETHIAASEHGTDRLADERPLTL